MASTSPPTTITSLMQAVESGKIDAVLHWSSLLAPSAETGTSELPVRAIDARDGEGRTAFHWAVALRNPDLATSLLQEPHCADPLTVDSNGTSTLATAIAARCPVALVEAIVARALAAAASWTSAQQEVAGEGGAPPDVPSPAVAFFNTADQSSGNTALHAAALRGDLPATCLLLQAGADPFLVSRLGHTPLHKAAARGSQDVAEALISHVRKTDLKRTKKFVNVQDSNGDSALHHAALENNKEFGEMLLRNGADRLAKNKQGREFWQMN